MRGRRNICRKWDSHKEECGWTNRSNGTLLEIKESSKLGSDIII